MVHFPPQKCLGWKIFIASFRNDEIWQEKTCWRPMFPTKKHANSIMVFEQKSGHPPGMNKRVYNSVNDEINDQPQLLQDFGNVIRP